MKGLKLLVLGTLLAVAQQSVAGSFDLGVSMAFGNGGGYGAYPVGAYPMGYGNNFGAVSGCMQSSYMQSAANSGAYYAPNTGYYNNPMAYNPNQGYMPQMQQQQMMPPRPALPDLAPPTPYVRAAPPMPAGPIGPGFNGPPPGYAQQAMMVPSCACTPAMNGAVMSSNQYLGDGITTLNNGQVIVVDDRGTMEWEKNDTAGIMFAVGGTLTGLASNVTPYAPYRYDPTVIPSFYNTGDRDVVFTPRTDAH